MSQQAEVYRLRDREGSVKDYKDERQKVKL